MGTEVVVTVRESRVMSEIPPADISKEGGVEGQDQRPGSGPAEREWKRARKGSAWDIRACAGPRVGPPLVAPPTWGLRDGSVGEPSLTARGDAPDAC